MNLDAPASVKPNHMTKMKKNNRARVDAYQELRERAREIREELAGILDACKRENRARNEQETARYEELTREMEGIEMQREMFRMEDVERDSQELRGLNQDTDRFVRDRLLNEGQPVTIALQREVTPQTTAALADTGIVPVSEQAMLEPVRKGLIYDKVGLHIASGLAGKLRWPKHGKAVASFADEAERLVDSSIDFGKLEMSGHRMGIAIPVTREELEDSQGVVENVIRRETPAAIIDLINDALFCTDKKYTGADKQQHDRKVYGPFVDLASSPVEFAGELPTRKELLKLVSTVSKKVDMIAPCFVMTEDMKTQLRDVKVDAGSGRFLCENDAILGYPVFTTGAIGEGFIGFGDWSYQAAGFFGAMSLIVDPYTLARANSVDFVLNGRFGTTTLRKEAFVLGKVKSL